MPISCSIIPGDNAAILPMLPAAFARLIYIDPPFNTKKVQKRDRMRVTRVRKGDTGNHRRGFGDNEYSVEKIVSSSYEDSFEDYEAFLMPRIKAALRCLTPDGSLFVHLDWHEVHYIKVALDKMLGRDHFMNEIIWSYDYGGRSKSKWSAKHDNILWYVADPKNYVFNYDEIDRIPYLAPGLVGAEKAERGKTPTSVWWNTIVPTNGKEKTGYPTQKPLGIMNRLIKVHSKPDDTVLDFFAGSGSTGEAAIVNGRGCVLIDSHPEAIRVMENRLFPIAKKLGFYNSDSFTVARHLKNQGKKK